METIWEEIKSVIKTGIPEHSYNMLIDPLQYLKSDENIFVVSSPNFFSKKRIIEHYQVLIESELKKLIGKNCKLSIDVFNDQNNLKERKQIPDRQLPLPNANINHSCGRLLRKDFTFDEFVVGNSNDFAYSAALSLATKSDCHQNSLFLLAKTGMGKTHLSQAIGHHILSKSPTNSVYYITAEDFTNEMVNALRDNSINSFKEKYRRKCDVLLLEDVHFLSGKERTQVELSLTLDTLYDSGKKIIFTSCYLPTDIAKMNVQLKSRLSSAVISNIEPPNFGTRIRILQKKSKTNGVKLPDDVTNYLANELSEDVRQLESGLVGVTAKSSLLGVPIDLNLAQSVVKNIAIQKKKVTIDVIKKVVCKHYNIAENDIISRSRKRCFVKPRQIAIYLSRVYTDSPLEAIGKSFNRYHATALHSISTVERGLKGNTSDSSVVKKQVEYLRKKLDTGDF